MKLAACSIYEIEPFKIHSIFLCVAASIPPLFSCAKRSTDMRPLIPHTYQTRWLILLTRSRIPVQVYIKAFAFIPVLYLDFTLSICLSDEFGAFTGAGTAGLFM